MLPLLNRLYPEGIELKGQLTALFFGNPFLETSLDALALRFRVEPDALARALDDLCRCGVLAHSDGRYRFAPEAVAYDGAAALAAAYRGEAAAVRQQVVEMETLARLRDALAVTHREVAAILEMVPVGVVLLDRYGHLLKSNALARRYLGLGTERAEADVCSRLGVTLEEVMEREVHAEADLACPLGIVSHPFRATGSETGAVMILQDMTYRREMELRAERIREEFFSMIRHELRKPLLTVERFLAGAPGAEALAQARTAASHLGAMVDDMLFLARLERDPMVVTTEDSVSLIALMAGSDLAYRTQAATAGVRVRMAPPGEEVVFCGDERRLAQVVGNLLDNAIKFTPSGGEVVLSGGRSEGSVWLSVADSGPGIPEPERERVFGKFYQIRSDDGRAQGLGLGLAISHRVVTAHGGRIEIADRPGGGADVTVRIPLESVDE